jgi:uncharacterized protein DUF6916
MEAGVTGDSILATVTHEQFSSCLNQPFLVRLGASTVETELVRVAALGAVAPARRQPFSLIFRGPMAPVLPQQRIYMLENRTLGTLEVFLVPIGSDQQGMQYEAVFS